MSGPQFKQPFSYSSHGFQHLGGFPRVPLPPSDPNNSDAAHVVGASMEGEKQTPSIKEMEEKLKTLVDTTNRFQIALQEAKQSLNLTQTALIQARVDLFKASKEMMSGAFLNTAQETSKVAQEE